MLTVTLTKGLPGSGKSYWAKQMVDGNPNGIKRINKDELRTMLDNGHHSDDTEKFILQVRNQLILQALAAGKHVIVDDTNFSPKHENVIRELVKDKAQVFIQDFTGVPIEDCIKNDLKRSNSVGEKVIRRMYNQYLRPKEQLQAPEIIPEAPDAIICDLDGTLCHLNGRSPYDASTCENDLLNGSVAEILQKFNNDGYQIIFTSGREDKYREQTIKFLRKHEIIPEDGFLESPQLDYLIMRATGDNRKDAIIKREMYENRIKGKFNIRFVLDDRNQVVEMWRSLGLTCLQVADGDF